MRVQALAKTRLLVKPWQYRLVYEQGKRVHGQNFSLIHVPNRAEGNRLGISVHGVKLAVQRNRIKRIIREFFRHNQGFIEPFSDVVFAVRSGFALKSPLEVAAAVGAVLARRKDGGRKADTGEEAVRFP